MFPMLQRVFVLRSDSGRIRIKVLYNQVLSTLATLPTSTYTGKSKIKSAKNNAGGVDRTQDLVVFTLMHC